MMRAAMWIVTAVLLTAGLAISVGSPASAAAAAPTGECRSQSASGRPSATSDDIVNCVVQRVGPSRVKLTVTYTYASPLGNQNILLGVDLLADGNRLKWFGYRLAPVNGSGGTATIEVVFGVNSPPAGKLTTDHVEFFMYVGGGQIFYRKMFTLKNDWQL